MLRLSVTSCQHGGVQQVLARHRAMMTTTAAAGALPQRHSRHEPPPTCTSSAQLQEMTQELLESKPGSLSTYLEPSNIDDDRGYAWDVANVAIQKTEFVIRGHASQIPNTICWNELKENNKETASSTLSPQEHIDKIQSLLQRLTHEGQMYMKLREEVQQTRALALVKEEELDEGKIEEKADGSEDETTDSAQPEFAAPGPTVTMYDTLLDSMAITTTPQTPKAVGTVLETVMDRHYEDVSGNINKNPYTLPTILTFNAVLRAIASTPYNQEEPTRDDALYYAFGTYDGMRDVVDRNSATYVYMLQTVAKYLPASATRGNIAHALWLQARRERIIHDDVLDALRLANQPSNGPVFDDWISKHMNKEKVVPLKFRRNAMNRRHNRQYATY